MSEEALRKASDKQFYGKLGPASPVKRIDPKTGEVVEIISEREWTSKYLESMNWAKGGIVFFFAVMIAIWLAAVWFFFLPEPPALFN
jgi:hypothetical protein